jgi:hypothetical protein
LPLLTWPTEYNSEAGTVIRSMRLFAEQVLPQVR